jgi:hypothetical protein
MRMGTIIALTLLSMFGISRELNSRSEIPTLAVDSAFALPPRVFTIVKRQCADCHSNATRWPWYSYVPPASWLIRRDVDHARRVLNFSQPPVAAGAQAPVVGALSAVCGVTKSGHMPPLRYRFLHPGSKLNAADQTELCQWTKAEIPQLSKITAREGPSDRTQSAP